MEQKEPDELTSWVVLGSQEIVYIHGGRVSKGKGVESNWPLRQWFPHLWSLCDVTVGTIEKGKEGYLHSLCILAAAYKNREKKNSVL